MIVDMVAFVVVVALASFLGHRLMEIDGALVEARGRIRSVVNSEKRLAGKLDGMKDQEKSLGNEITQLREAIEELREAYSAAQREAEQARALSRPRLLVLSERKTPGDVAWVVTLTQDKPFGEDHPLAAEWNEGRQFLVFAKSEQDARQRAVRRFSNRPRYSLQSISAVKAGIFRE